MSILILMLMASAFSIMGSMSQAHAQLKLGNIVVIDKEMQAGRRGLALQG